jgi:hypothetical protein
MRILRNGIDNTEKVSIFALQNSFFSCCKGESGRPSEGKAAFFFNTVQRILQTPSRRSYEYQKRRTLHLS